MEEWDDFITFNVVLRVNKPNIKVKKRRILWITCPTKLTVIWIFISLESCVINEANIFLSVSVVKSSFHFKKYSDTEMTKMTKTKKKLRCNYIHLIYEYKKCIVSKTIQAIYCNIQNTITYDDEQ